MGKLVHFLVNGDVREIKLDRERITIGRRPDNDLCLPQPPVSGAHAAIVTILADSFLEDLGSTNGTLVNGRAITKHFLRDRDEIDIGREILVYLADDSATLDMPPRSRERARDAGEGKGVDSSAPPDAGAHPAGDGMPRWKRRSDAQTAPGQPGDDLWEDGPAGVDGGPGGALPASPAAAEGDEGPLPATPVEPPPVVRILTGFRAGSVVALAKSETLVGRAGVQVAALKRLADEVRIVAIEGANRPSVNGTPIDADGQRLVSGDILEIAGTRLELRIRDDVPQ
jgi:hypothetical protein